jgi:hypothetical protein
MDGDERPADHTEDPREQETAESGYPETSPAGAQGGEAEGGRDRSGGDTGSDAPSPATDEETDREKTTGNPGAAG